VLPDIEKPFVFPVIEELILTQEEDGKMFTDIMETKAKLWVYGVVRYEDGVSFSEHETRFCYLCVPVGNVILVSTGPEIYRRCT
jgi:hypothetical protein